MALVKMPLELLDPALELAVNGHIHYLQPPYYLKDEETLMMAKQ